MVDVTEAGGTAKSAAVSAVPTGERKSGPPFPSGVRKPGSTLQRRGVIGAAASEALSVLSSGVSSPMPRSYTQGGGRNTHEVSVAECSLRR
jgi:hypothetical protein